LKYIKNSEGKMKELKEKDGQETVEGACTVNEKPEILEEIVIEKIGIDGICGVY
jgi:mycofactocin precursor